LRSFIPLFIAFTLFIFSGCSLQKVYEPKFTTGTWKDYGDLNSSIVDVENNVAALQEQKLLVDDKLLDFPPKLDAKSRVISYKDKKLIFTSFDDNLTVDNGNKSITFNFAKTVATAAVSGDTLAVLFGDDEMALYSLSTKEPFFKAQGGEAIALDSKITPPFFMRDLVVFSTLDGKVVIVSTRFKKVLRSVLVSAQEYFNNIIYFNIIDNKIIAATNKALLSLSVKEIKNEYEAREIKYDGKFLYLFTKQGEVLKLDSNLDVVKKIKFPFAHFLAVVLSDDTLYIYEKEGYLILLNKDNLEDYLVYKVNMPEGYVYESHDRIYQDSIYLQIVKPKCVECQTNSKHF